MSDQIHGSRVAIEFDARNPQKDVFKEVDLRARAAMSKDKDLSYQAAVNLVFTADEELLRQYVESVPPVHMNRGGA